MPPSLTGISEVERVLVVVLVGNGVVLELVAVVRSTVEHRNVNFES